MSSALRVTRCADQIPLATKYSTTNLDLLPPWPPCLLHPFLHICSRQIQDVHPQNEMRHSLEGIRRHVTKVLQPLWQGHKQVSRQYGTDSVYIKMNFS